jgi:AcrR family transcriptional regulator
MPRATATTRPPRQARRYHHGNLRAALLAAADSLLRERGVEGFTLRECARRAGVSHAAPAHHFGDVAGLFTAYVTESFRALAAQMERYEVAAGADAVARLEANGLAYVDFAVAHRARFELMFRGDCLDRSDATLREAGAVSFGRLREALIAARRGRSLPVDAALEPKLILAWSVVHGLATRYLDGRLEHWRGESAGPQFAHALGGSVLGQTMAALLQP